VTETSPIILVLPGGGYSRLAPHEGEPVAEWLRGIGWRARVVEYPVQTRHPGPLDVVRAEIAAERAAGVGIVGVLGFSAGGHLAGHAALTLAGGERPDFAVLCYPVVTMLADTHRGSRDQLLGPGWLMQQPAQGLQVADAAKLGRALRRAIHAVVFAYFGSTAT